MKNIGWVAICAPILFACSEQPSQEPTTPSAVSDSADSKIAAESAVSKVDVLIEIEAGKDYHSFANPSEVRVTHLDLDLTADFETSTLSGSATLTVERSAPNFNTVVLDTRALNITKR